MNEFNDDELFEMATALMNQAQDCYFAGDYERVLELCYPFTERNVVLATPYIYSALTFITMAESGNFGDRAYEFLSLCYQIAHKGIIATMMAPGNQDYSLLYFLKGKALHPFCNVNLDPEEQVFKRRILNDLVILDAIDCLEKAIELPDVMYEQKNSMLTILNNKKTGCDRLLVALASANKDFGAMIDAMELMTTFEEFKRDSEKLLGIAKNQQNLLRSVDSLSNISESERNMLDNYCSGLMGLTIGQPHEARDKYFAAIYDWNPGGVVTTGIKMANVCIEMLGDV